MADRQSKPGTPLWKRAVDRADSVITPPSNSFVRTDLFADAVTTVTRIDQRLRRIGERRTRQVLHALNLPAASDIRRVYSQMSALEARVRDIQERLDDQDRERIATWRQPADESTPSAKTSNARSSARRTASSTSRGSG